MKISLFFFLLPFIVTTTQAEQKPFLISGFDDVLRQAENTSLIKAAIKIFHKDRGFSGMPELYQAVTDQEPSPQFTLVSAISNWFDSRINKFLIQSNFPTNRRHLRNWLTEWSIESFKIKTIRKLLEEKPNRKFIVIFDNSDASINLTKEIKRKFSEKVAVIYLRQVQRKKTPPGSVEFYTAFDIAIKEYESERLSSKDVVRVGRAILNESDINSLIPDYSICPTNYSPCKMRSSGTHEICSKVRRHVQSLCKH